MVSSSGLKPNPAKTEAIATTNPPTDKTGVEMRGTDNYLSRFEFVPKLSDVIRPISDLTRPDVEWTWESVHDKAFAEIKRLLAQAPVLAFFDSTKEVSIQCDASGQGLCATLLRNHSPHRYRNKTDAQQWKRKCLLLYSLSKGVINAYMVATKPSTLTTAKDKASRIVYISWLNRSNWVNLHGAARLRNNFYLLELNFERIPHNTEYVLRCL